MVQSRERNHALMRVAFSILGGDHWTGGIHYLRNLLSAVADLDGKRIEPLLFVSPNAEATAVDLVAPYLAEAPIVVDGWSRSPLRRVARLTRSSLLQRDWISEAAFRKANVDVVFQHAAWYGLAFPIPTLAWIADFQHRHLPRMFTWATRVKRDLGYEALSRCATRIMLSSQNARVDCERFFPRSISKISVVPFRVQLSEQVLSTDPAEIRRGYGLPERYFYLPNQFWRHKNHLALIEGLRILVHRSADVVVAVSGNPSDNRNPNYPETVFETVKRYRLEDRFKFLGMLPHEHIVPLMRGALAVINPSLFEGWSTTVEEAIAVGAPLLLSDLAVHREQAAGIARFFDPNDPYGIADCMAHAWQEIDMTDRIRHEARAISSYRAKRREFAESFASVLESTVRGDKPFQ